MIGDAAAWIVVAGAFTGGFVNGLTGFGTSMTAMPLWLQVLAPVVASPLAVACSIVGQLQTLPAIWHAMDRRRVWPFIAGGVFGVPLGALLIPRIDVATFKGLVGALLVVSCAFLLLYRRRSAWEGGGRAVEAGVGFAGGIFGGLAGISGILPTLLAELRGWEKDVRRAVFQGFNVTILMLALGWQAAAGLFTREVGALLLMALPGTLIGVWLGRRIYTRLDTRRFAKLILGLLLVAGVVLVYGAVAAPGP